MKLERSISSESSTTRLPAQVVTRFDSHSSAKVGRRYFLKGPGLAGVSLASVTKLLNSTGAQADEFRRKFRRGLTQGDVDILRFLAAAEILETDLWVQYQEMANNNPAYQAAINVLDSDMVQYIDDYTDDENSHQMFLNAFLVSVGAEPVNLERFRTLPGSQATGSTKMLRLTNLLNLNVDTSWYTRYRSTKNPDFGEVFTGPISIVNRPAIPVNDIDTPPNQIPPSTHMQAIANTAGFHIATVEQGGASLYGSFIPMATSLVVLRILYAIGGAEVAHFQTWHDKAGNARVLTDNQPGFLPVTFPDLHGPPFGGEAFQTNLIMPEPCEFISKGLPVCSIIRPTLRKNAGALAVVDFLKKMGLFKGQSRPFFLTLEGLAAAANTAKRQVEQEEDERDDWF